MLKKCLTMLLGFAMVWLHAVGVQGVQPQGKVYGIQVHTPPAMQTDGANANGRIKLTAALPEKPDAEMQVVFLVSDAYHTRSVAVWLADEMDASTGLFTASAQLDNMAPGKYQISLAYCSGAALSRIVAENGDRSQYLLQENTITYVLSEETPTGSAWFMLEQEEDDGAQ